MGAEAVKQQLFVQQTVFLVTDQKYLERKAVLTMFVECTLQKNAVVFSGS